MKKMSHTFRYKQKHIYEIDMSLWCLCFCCCKTPLTTEVSTCIVADVMPPYTLAGTAYLCGCGTAQFPCRSYIDVVTSLEIKHTLPAPHKPTVSE